MTDKIFTLNDKQMALFEQVCERIAEGESIRVSCKDIRGVSKPTFLQWIKDERDTGGAVLSDMYAQAKESSADALADQLIEIADNIEGDTKRDQLRLDTRKWIAAKLKPRKYGDRIQADVGGSINVNISTDDGNCA